MCAIEKGHNTHASVMKETSMSSSAVKNHIDYLLTANQIHVAGNVEERHISGPHPRIYKFGPPEKKKLPVSDLWAAALFGLVKEKK